MRVRFLCQCIDQSLDVGCAQEKWCDLEQVERLFITMGNSCREMTVNICQWQWGGKLNPLAFKEIWVSQKNISCVARIQASSVSYSIKNQLDFFSWEKLWRGRLMEQSTAFIAVPVHRATADTHHFSPSTSPHLWLPLCWSRHLIWWG
jgi:hypothetical protein